MLNKCLLINRIASAVIGTSLLHLSGIQALHAAQNVSHRPPNFVVVLCDDLGWGDLGCYGNENIKTPNIDRLAREGLLFTSFYVNSPVCSPARAGIMTGRFPSTLGIHYAMGHHDWNAQHSMPDYLDPKTSTVTMSFKNAGYKVGHFGKWHLGGPYNKETPKLKDYGIDEYATLMTPGEGWPEYINPGDPRSEWAKRNIDASIRFIEDNKDKPFYLNVWLFDVHSTVDPSDEQMESYKEYWMRVGPEPTSREYRGAMQIYYAAVSNMDKQIGRLLARLDELGLSGDTIVVLTSDNGPSTVWSKDTAHSGAGSAGPFRGCKGSLYEGGIREPFIVRWPQKVPANKVDDTTILSGVDLLPSFCSIAGIQLPDGAELDGEDMSSALLGIPKVRKKQLMWEFRFRPNGGGILDRSPLLAARDGKWKLLMNPDNSRVELYDLTKDPSEVDNVAALNKKLVSRMSASLLKWHKSLPNADKIPPTAGSNDYPWPKGGNQVAK